MFVDLVGEGEKGGVVIGMREDFCGKGGGGTALHLFLELFHILLPGAAEEEELIVIFLDFLTWECVEFEFFV